MFGEFRKISIVSCSSNIGTPLNDFRKIIHLENDFHFAHHHAKTSNNYCSKKQDQMNLDLWPREKTTFCH